MPGFRIETCWHWGGDSFAHMFLPSAEAQAAGDWQTVPGIPGPTEGRPGRHGHFDPADRWPMCRTGVEPTVPRVDAPPPQDGYDAGPPLATPLLRVHARVNFERSRGWTPADQVFEFLQDPGQIEGDVSPVWESPQKKSAVPRFENSNMIDKRVQLTNHTRSDNKNNCVGNDEMPRNCSTQTH